MLADPGVSRRKLNTSLQRLPLALRIWSEAWSYPTDVSNHAMPGTFLGAMPFLKLVWVTPGGRRMGEAGERSTRLASVDRNTSGRRAFSWLGRT